MGTEFSWQGGEISDHIAARADLKSYVQRPGDVTWVPSDELHQARAPRPSPHTDEWYQTYSGQRIDLLNFKAADVRLEDVMHDLPGLARFGAHARRLGGNIYTVGEHSCLIAWYAQHMLRRPKADVKLALFHDAAETYTGDVKRPVKNKFPELRTVLRPVEDATADALGVPRGKPDWLRELDERIIVDEKDALMRHPVDGTLWSHERAGLKGLGVPIRCLAPDAVEAWMWSIYQEVKDA